MTSAARKTRWTAFAVLGVAAAAPHNVTVDDHVIVRGIREASGAPATAADVAEALIDDRFDVLRREAHLSFAPDDAAAVLDAFGGSRQTSKKRGNLLPSVPVIEVRASNLNASALCAFLAVGVPALAEAPTIAGFVLLSLGSAAHGSPWHPAILRTLEASCGKSAADLSAVLKAPKLRRWFVSQHFPLTERGTRMSRRGSSSRAARYDAALNPHVGDISHDPEWVLHAKLHVVPLGLPRIFSKRLERETAWLDLLKSTVETPRKRRRQETMPYVNFKPRPYRDAVARAVARGLGVAELPNRYVGKKRVVHRHVEDTTAYLRSMFEHRFVLSPPGSGVDCYRHWEALLCGAIPIVEYSPVTADLLGALPTLLVRNWNGLSRAKLDAVWRDAMSRRWDFRVLTTRYWRDELREAREVPGWLVEEPAGES